MSGGLILGCVLAILIGYRIYQRRRIDRAIAQSAVFTTTPIRYKGSKRKCREAEAIAIDHGWQKTSEHSWQIFWRQVRFAPSGEGAAKPQQVLAAFDQPYAISKIELPGSPKPKEK